MLEGTFQQAPGVLYQTSIDIVPYGSVSNALKDKNWEPLDDEAVVGMLSCRGDMFELNVTGAYIWELLATGKKIAHVADLLEEQFSASRSECLVAAQEYIATLVENGLVTRV